MTIEEAKRIIDTNYTGINDKNNIYLNTDGEVPYVQSKAFSGLRGINHGFTTRLGGVSTGIYESLNLGFLVGDDAEPVMENYKRLAESAGFDYTRISTMYQQHTTNILDVKEEDAGDGISKERTHIGYDAQITNVPNIPLFVYSADCVPIILADPISRVVAAVHSGWRGTVQGIGAKVVQKMIEDYGCLPENIYAFIGPSIGPENYEVDQMVIDEIIKCPYIDMSEDNISALDIYLEHDDDWQSKLKAGMKLSQEELFHKDVYIICHAGSYMRENMPENYIGVKQVNKGAAYSIFRTVKFRKRYMLNLWNLNELILVNAGLSMGNIICSRLCTMKNHDLFFSHRYTNGHRGLHAGFIMLDR